MQQGNLCEAALLIGDVAQLATASRSPRILRRIGELRSALTKWNGSQEFKEPDGRLSGYGLGFSPDWSESKS